MKISRTLFLTLTLITNTLFMSLHVLAETKVANFSSGKIHSKDYRKFSFYTSNEKASKVIYTYGEDFAEVKGQLSENSKMKDSFKVMLEDEQVFIITVKREELLISTEADADKRAFQWEYEGPVEGIGTFCEQCAEDPQEAIKLVRQAYLQK